MLLMDMSDVSIMHVCACLDTAQMWMEDAGQTQLAGTQILQKATTWRPLFLQRGATLLECSSCCFVSAGCSLCLTVWWTVAQHDAGHVAFL
mmetsp:Transcript_64048/g.169662  ORF Transcript_64048/g.169662 Transcript_64048/m.169662 type:complete len:91 (-) Transcript_64048:172-444(-)